MNFCILSIVIYIGRIHYEEKIRNYSNELKKVNEIKNGENFNSIKELNWGEVKCSMWNPLPSQGWGDGNILFDGTKIDKNLASGYRYLAVSHDIADLYPLGSYVIISGLNDYYDGVWQVRCRMNSKWKKKVDFMQTKGHPVPPINKCLIAKINIT